MKKLLSGVAAAILFAVPALAADPVEGLWQTEKDDGAFAHVDVHPCGSAICGTIVATFNESGQYQSPNIGKDLILGMVPVGDGKYEGKVWRPSNDKTYMGKLTLSGNALRMEGCVLGGLYCAKQTWVRLQ